MASIEHRRFLHQLGLFGKFCFYGSCPQLLKRKSFIFPPDFYPSHQTHSPRASEARFRYLSISYSWILKQPKQEPYCKFLSLKRLPRRRERRTAMSNAGIPINKSPDCKLQSQSRSGRDTAALSLLAAHRMNFDPARDLQSSRTPFTVAQTVLGSSHGPLCTSAQPAWLSSPALDAK